MKIANNIENARLKLEAAQKELNTHLLNYKNTHNPKLKEGHKIKAANALKKKKMYEAQLSSLENSQFTLESMQIQSEMMNDQISVIKTIHQTSIAQQNLMKEMNVDSMHDIADYMRDMQNDMEEMTQVIQESYKIDVDDDELDAELDELDFTNKDNFNPVELTAPNKNLLSKKERDAKQLEDELNL